jgi:NADH-quinone oxidoreductase subunit D
MVTALSLIAISIGPCHPSAHGVFRIVAVLVSELIRWLDLVVGLLHRATEFISEHRMISHVPGYLSRTDYVAHLQLESLVSHICPRLASNDRSHLGLLHHLCLLANHTLNICCSVGDLGCLSFILWGFEDRECIFRLLERVSGARLHNWLDSGVTGSHAGVDSRIASSSVFSSRHTAIFDVLLLRHNLSRMYGAVSIDMVSALSSQFSGPMLFSTGFSADLRQDCYMYSRSSLSSFSSGTMSCTFVRLSIRLNIYILFLYVVLLIDGVNLYVNFIYVFNMWNLKFITPFHIPLRLLGPKHINLWSLFWI